MLIRKIRLGDSLPEINVECANDTLFGDTAVKFYQDYKISLVLSDDCGAVIGGNAIFPKRGDIVIFRPEEIHFGRFPKSEKYRFVSFLIPVNLFEKVFVHSQELLSPFLDNAEDKINLIRPEGSYKQEMIKITEEAISLLLDGEEDFSDILVFAKLIEALDILKRLYPEQKKRPVVSTLPPVVAKALELMQKEFPSFSGLEELSVQCGCSVTYLTQSFRHHIGTTIHGYLTSCRLENARRLLQEGLGVTEACYQSGFSDCSRFISLFKREFNTTPGKYKISAKNKTG